MGIELSQGEIDAYMQESPRGVLCVTREARAPLALPMWFAWIDGKIVMTTQLAAKKVAAIRKNPLVSFLVESGRDYFTLKALLLMGPCEIEEHPEGAAEAMGRIHEHKPLYRELFPKDLPPHLVKHYAKPHATLTIAPTAITSWDFAKVRA